MDSELAKSSLSPSDKALVTTLVYGVMRQRGLLDYHLSQLTSAKFAKKTPERTLCALRLGAFELMHLRTPDFAAVDQAVSLVGRQRSQRSFVNGVLRTLARRRDELKAPGDDPTLSPVDALAIETSTPAWLLRELSSTAEEEQGGQPLLASHEELCAWARASQQQPALALRVNHQRASRAQVFEQMHASSSGLAATVVDGIEEALLLDTAGGSVTSLPGFAEGHWSVQDLGAQLVGLLAAPPAADAARVLDLCSAPGGKATHLGERLGRSGGHVLAVEVHARKAKLIQQACERLGLSQSVTVRVADAASAPALHEILASRGWESGADAVLLDAPCSGTGTLRRNPEHRYRPQDASATQALGELQARLLDSAASCVRVGGTLTYSVCSPLLSETDVRVAAFLARNREFEVVPAADHGGIPPAYIADSALLGAGTCVRTWTHRHPADSHFAVQLRRHG